MIRSETHHEFQTIRSANRLHSSSVLPTEVIKAMVDDIRRRPHRPSEGQCRGQKVNHKRLSSLMKLILVHSADGIERGALVEAIFGLERRYRGYDADLCLRGRQKMDYETRYRRVQPVLSRSLRRLEERGLVELARPGRYAKQIALTEQGKQVVRELRRLQNSTPPPVMH